MVVVVRNDMNCDVVAVGGIEKLIVFAYVVLGLKVNNIMMIWYDTHLLNDLDILPLSWVNFHNV